MGKENLGCLISVAVEATIPFGPTTIAFLERKFNNIDTITKSDLFLMAGMEIGRIALGASAYNALVNQNMGNFNALFVGAMFYLSAGVAEMIYSASKVALHHRNRPK
ncbi:MAG: hypothetical protein HY515_00435 [Candidatus Aenigmarchaeota archaeon]|nr:hypothetical protein [Candidatus Aenigmarchaeota archaeon]